MKLVEWDRYTGRLAAVESVDVRARVSGYLDSIHFNEGQIVKKGQVLYIIDQRPFKAALESANAELASARARRTEAVANVTQAKAQKGQTDAALKLARKQEGRSRLAFRKQAITEDQYDVVKTALDKAEADERSAAAKVTAAEAAIKTAEATIGTANAAVEVAKLDLEFTVIRARVGGRISGYRMTEGNLVSGGSAQGTLLATIVSLDPIHCYFDANERELLKYIRLDRSGRRESSRNARNPVFLALEDETDFPHKGHMDFVDNRIDRNTGTIRGRAIFPNPGYVLTPGMFARVRLPGSASHEAILIPDSAVGTDQTIKFVYIVTGDGKVARRPVELGPLAHGLRIVRRGLKGDEQVIINGLQFVRPGAKVEVETASITPDKGEGLPDDYTPVPREKWLRQPRPEKRLPASAGKPAGNVPAKTDRGRP